MFARSSKRSAAASAAASPTPSQPRRNSTSSASSRRPRLERRNAAKNIYYDPYASSWTSSASSPDDSVGLRATRSLDLPYSNQTSFRIEGIEGEVDELCRSLGLSGPEEFAIPAAAWEARKARSALDILPPSRLIESQSSPESPSDSPRPRDSADPQGSPDVAVRDGFADLRSSPSPPKNSAGDVDGGIKGVRPPVLTPPQLRSPTMIRTLPPPPSMSLPMLEKTGSTWDLVKSFAPDDDGGGDAGKTLYGSDEDDDGERVVEDEGAAEVRFGETVHDLIGSCSFSTNDDDSSSTTTESMYVISPNGNFKITIGSWMRGGLLGSGSFGTVYEGINEDGFFFAAKEVSLLDQGSNAKQSILQLEQEIALLSQFEHENIVQYFGTDRKESKLYIFLELVTQGSLASLYQKYHLKDSQVSAYTRQILNGLNYLHDRNVVHRDIKCANILVGANGSVKLADFGLAKITKLNDLKSCKGSAFWMAPEVVNQKRSYGPAADIWSLGCTVLEMLTRQIPYPNLDWIQAILRIGRGEQPPIPSTLSKDARDFIRKCVQVNPDDRPTAAQLLDHPFVKRPLSTSSPENSVRNGTRTSKFV